MKIGNMLVDTQIPKLKYVSDLAKTNFQEWSSSFAQSHQVPQAQDYPLFRFFSILNFGTFLENFWSFLTTQMNNDKQKETLSLKNILLKRLLPCVCSNMAISILTFPKSLAKLLFHSARKLGKCLHATPREHVYLLWKNGRCCKLLVGVIAACCSLQVFWNEENINSSNWKGP